MLASSVHEAAWTVAQPTPYTRPSRPSGSSLVVPGAVHVFAKEQEQEIQALQASSSRKMRWSPSSRMSIDIRPVAVRRTEAREVGRR